MAAMPHAAKHSRALSMHARATAPAAWNVHDDRPSAALSPRSACSPPWRRCRPRRGPKPRKITFILMNDIYQMGDTLMPDGQRRGGFARLAAVVKAERAKGGHVVLAHGGDTLSPSLMSGIDQGAHIVTLTNMIRPDIFAPGNHEFDFGKAVFLKRMAEAKFPVYAANLRAAGRHAAARLQGPRHRHLRRRAHRPDRRRPRRHAAHVELRGPEIPADRRHHEDAGRGAAPRGRRFRGRRHARRPQAGLSI